MPEIIRKKTIIFELSDQLHREVKSRSAYKGMSMTAWILQALVMKIAEEQKYEQMQEVSEKYNIRR